jgi:hypothetical protein
MKSAIIAGVVAMLVSSASATAAFVVTSKNIKNGTIQTVDLSAKARKALKGKAGPAGARGPQGPAGPQGPPGFVGATRIVSATFSVPVNTAGSPQTVSCPDGTGVISGGVVSETHGDTWVDAPSGNGWSGAANNALGTSPGEVTVYALCAQGVAAPSTSSASVSTGAAAAATRKAASQTE